MAAYVDNKQLYKEICKWKNACYDAGEQVKIPDTIGQAIMDIAKGLTKYWRFSGYTSSWKQEMYWDGIEAVVKGLYGFDEKRYHNPHAYITQACYNAYIQRLKKEYKEMAIKYSFFIHHVYDEYDEDMSRLADEEFIQDIYDKLNVYETSRTTTSKPRSTGPTLEQFYDDEDNTKN